MEKLDTILAAVGLLIIGIGVVYILSQKKVEKAKGEGPVLRPEDDVKTDATSSLN